ncbi:hypothetical protein VN97_g3649 [Penicillium thymicola]|uniref:Uncharacterized protein n=1 Tax=Penicillium thymicola TaxID=293382 RepID=A0AAI9TN91_PENTH|nr:hypothetical protein VN97_g3649 [Penicillium thymicola]
MESENILGGILYDILRFYRFTDTAWRVPLPTPAAPAPASTPSEGSSGDLLVAANLDMLTDAAIQVLGPTATTPTPLETLAEVASIAEPYPTISPTYSLDIIAAAAATRPYAAVPAPIATPAPIDSPAPRAKRSRDDETDDESEQPAKKKQAVSPK